MLYDDDMYSKMKIYIVNKFNPKHPTIGSFFQSCITFNHARDQSGMPPENANNDTRKHHPSQYEKMERKWRLCDHRIAIAWIHLFPWLLLSFALAGPSGSSSSPLTPPLTLSHWIRRVKFGSFSDETVSTSTKSTTTTASSLSASSVSATYSPFITVWAYRGALYDLLNGQHIANVQGVELLRPLAHYDSSSSTLLSSNQQQRQQDFLSKCGDLQVAKTMREYWNSCNNETCNSSQDDAVDVTTAWSRKFFCYQAPNNDNEGEKATTTTSSSTCVASSLSSSSSRLLDSIRLRPTAPRRKVPPSQAMACYDTIVSYLSPSSKRRHDDGTLESSLVLLHTEFPNRQTVHGVAQAQQSQPNALDLNIYTRPSAAAASSNKRKQQQALHLPTLLLSSSSSSNNNNSNSSTIPASSSSSSTTNPPRIRRSSLIQFGASSQTTLNRYGARETYSYQIQPLSSDGSSLPKSKSTSSGWFQNRFAAATAKRKSSARTTTTTATVRYTRQGEGPPWYGPHRLCTLELQGQRLDDDDDELEKFLAQQQQRGGVAAICQLWAKQAMEDWKSHQHHGHHDDDMVQFRNPASREAIMAQVRSSLQPQQQPQPKTTPWQEAVTTQAQLYWQRLSASLSTRTLRRRDNNDDDDI
jgi:hypothetical protein